MTFKLYKGEWNFYQVCGQIITYNEKVHLILWLVFMLNSSSLLSIITYSSGIKY